MSLLNYFQLFELEINFDIDTQALHQRYLALQRETHPDRFDSGSKEHQLAVRSNSYLNQAYDCLKRPIERARYMLSLFVHIDLDNYTNKDTDFLLQQMQLCETLEGTDNQQQLDQLQKDIQQQLRQGSEQFSQHYQQQQFALAQESLEQMMFYNKLLKDIEQKSFAT